MITKVSRWALLPLATALGLTGCTLQPNYHRPTMPVKAH